VGVFLRSDSVTTGFTAGADNTFLINATNGVGINTNNPQATLDVSGAVKFGNSEAPSCTGQIKFSGDNFYGCTGSAWVPFTR